MKNTLSNGGIFLYRKSHRWRDWWLKSRVFFGDKMFVLEKDKKREEQRKPQLVSNIIITQKIAT